LLFRAFSRRDKVFVFADFKRSFVKICWGLLTVIQRQLYLYQVGNCKLKEFYKLFEHQILIQFI
jgi:hypothetical protein